VTNPNELVLPDPCLVVLVGAAGAGKTTFARRHFAAEAILSSDRFREHIAGDAADQRATGAAFAALHRALKRRLDERQLTVVDATSVRRNDRQPLVRAAEAAGVPCIAIVLDLPAGLVRERNARRGGKVVPDLVVRRHLARLAESMRPPGLMAEGFSRVYSLRDAESLDRTTIVSEVNGDAPSVNGRNR
jgi:protein phosphatase